MCACVRERLYARGHVLRGKHRRRLPRHKVLPLSPQHLSPLAVLKPYTHPGFRNYALPSSFSDQELLGRSSLKNAGVPAAGPPHPVRGRAPGRGRALPGSESLGAALRTAAAVQVQLGRRSWPSRTGRGSHSSGTCSGEGTRGKDWQRPIPSLEAWRPRPGPLSQLRSLRSFTDLSPSLSPPHRSAQVPHAEKLPNRMTTSICPTFHSLQQLFTEYQPV